jgi:hypothetical protein
MPNAAYAKRYSNCASGIAKMLSRALVSSSIDALGSPEIQRLLGRVPSVANSSGSHNPVCHHLDIYTGTKRRY